MNEDEEKLLSPSEVKEIMEGSFKEPTVIYSGPEADDTMVGSFQTVESLDEVDHEKIELSFEKRATLEQVANLIRIKGSDLKKMVKELGAIERVTNVHSYKIAEIMPRDETELRPIFAKERFSLTPEETSTIIKVIDKYRI